MTSIDQFIEYWSNPANVYYEVTVHHPKWLMYIEYTAGAFGALAVIAAAIVAISITFLGAVYELFNFTEKINIKNFLKL